MNQTNKVKLDRLFLAHAAVSCVVGIVAYVVPGLFGFCLGEEFLLHHAGDGKKTDLTVRLYGALLFGQAYIVYKMRRVTEGEVRRALVQAFTAVFTASGLALTRSHFTDESIPLVNWVNMLVVWTLAGFYGHFAFFSPPPIFRGLDREG
eukprot:GEMP01072712.1.p1 GENE.GEMP01072712.1~~GEMP01072712.1.p1  ORF type:complete len:149 (+),score=28.38 GEMP01072712.1:59-505(+)